MVSVSQVEGEVRCVVCRGTRQPPTLPRPLPTTLPLLPPLLPGGERGELEQQAASLALTTSLVAQAPSTEVPHHLTTLTHLTSPPRLTSLHLTQQHHLTHLSSPFLSSPLLSSSHLNLVHPNSLHLTPSHPHLTPPQPTRRGRNAWPARGTRRSRSSCSSSPWPAGATFTSPAHLLTCSPGLGDHQ